MYQRLLAITIALFFVAPTIYVGADETEMERGVIATPFEDIYHISDEKKEESYLVDIEFYNLDPDAFINYTWRIYYAGSSQSEEVYKSTSNESNEYFEDSFYNTSALVMPYWEENNQWIDGCYSFHVDGFQIDGNEVFMVQGSGFGFSVGSGYENTCGGPEGPWADAQPFQDNYHISGSEKQENYMVDLHFEGMEPDWTFTYYWAILFYTIEGGEEQWVQLYILSDFEEAKTDENGKHEQTVIVMPSNWNENGEWTDGCYKFVLDASGGLKDYFVFTVGESNLTCGVDNGEECPFHDTTADSPCNAQECQGDKKDSPDCHEYVEAYCADHPDDEGCKDIGNIGGNTWYCKDCNCQYMSDADGYGQAPEGFVQCHGGINEGEHDDGEGNDLPLGLPTGMFSELFQEMDVSEHDDHTESYGLKFITPLSASLWTTSKMELDTETSDTLRQDIILASMMKELNKNVSKQMDSILLDYESGEADAEETLEALFNMSENATMDVLMKDHMLPDSDEEDDDNTIMMGEDLNPGINPAEILREKTDFTAFVIEQEHIDDYMEVAWGTGAMDLFALEIGMTYTFLAMIMVAFSGFACEEFSDNSNTDEGAVAAEKPEYCDDFEEHTNKSVEAAGEMIVKVIRECSKLKDQYALFFCTYQEMMLLMEKMGLDSKEDDDNSNQDSEEMGITGWENPIDCSWNKTANLWNCDTNGDGVEDDWWYYCESEKGVDASKGPKWYCTDRYGPDEKHEESANNEKRKDKFAYCLDADANALTPHSTGDCEKGEKMVVYGETSSNMDFFIIDGTGPVLADELDLDKDATNSIIDIYLELNVAVAPKMELKETKNILGKYGDNKGKKITITITSPSELFFYPEKALGAEEYQVEFKHSKKNVEELNKNPAPFTISAPAGYDIINVNISKAIGTYELSEDENDLIIKPEVSKEIKEEDWIFKFTFSSKSLNDALDTLNDANATDEEKEAAADEIADELPSIGLVAGLLSIFAVATLRRRL